MNLKNLADLSQKILNQDTNYKRDKKIISTLFKKKLDTYEETIIFRLTIIDAYYSTQMDKRLYGIDDIAYRLSNISKDDNELRRKFINFLKFDENDIKALFEYRGYGMKKNGNSAGMAPSLISKYAYFLTNYKFPIYDSLVVNSFAQIKNHCESKIDNLNKEFETGYFRALITLNNESGIKNIDKLDNLIWLYGKFSKGSFSLVIKKQEYKELIKLALCSVKDKKPKTKNMKLYSKDIDKKIYNYLRKSRNTNSLNGILSKNVIEFLTFVNN